jgi:hypothetical protein
MTNNKQQTAVEFYLDKIFDIIGDDILDKLSIEQINKIHDLSKQAKEMEKDQINDAYFQGFEDNVWDSLDDNFNLEYYNETYGGGEQ